MDQIYYAHEHVTIDLSGVKNTLDCRLDEFEKTVEEFRALHDRGVRTIIDQTARGMGRNIPYAQAVGEASGVRIFHATGFYKAPFLPEECYTRSERELADLMIADLTVGMEGTSIRANHIGEIGTGSGSIKPEEQKVFAAACLAHHETGAAICTHCTLGALGLEQIAVFRQFNVPLERVVLSHIDLSGDYDYMLALLDQGVNIAFDTVGKENYMPDFNRAKWLADLCRAGYVNQILLSMDITRRSQYRQNGGLGYAYLVDGFLPMAVEAGCKTEWIDWMLRQNPARIYGE